MIKREISPITFFQELFGFPFPAFDIDFLNIFISYFINHYNESHLFIESIIPNNAQALISLHIFGILGKIIPISFKWIRQIIQNTGEPGMTSFLDDIGIRPLIANSYNRKFIDEITNIIFDLSKINAELLCNSLYNEPEFIELIYNVFNSNDSFVISNLMKSFRNIFKFSPQLCHDLGIPLIKYSYAIFSGEDSDLKTSFSSAFLYLINFLSDENINEFLFIATLSFQSNIENVIITGIRISKAIAKFSNCNSLDLIFGELEEKNIINIIVEIASNGSYKIKKEAISAIAVFCTTFPFNYLETLKSYNIINVITEDNIFDESFAVSIFQIIRFYISFDVKNEDEMNIIILALESLKDHPSIELYEESQALLNMLCQNS